MQVRHRESTKEVPDPSLPPSLPHLLATQAQAKHAGGSIVQLVDILESEGGRGVEGAVVSDQVFHRHKKCALHADVGRLGGREGGRKGRKEGVLGEYQCFKWRL